MFRMELPMIVITQQMFNKIPRSKCRSPDANVFTRQGKINEKFIEELTSYVICRRDEFKNGFSSK